MIFVSDTPRVNRYKTVAAIDVIFGVFGIALAVLILVDGNSLLALTVLAIGCLSAGFGVALWVSADIVNGVRRRITCEETKRTD